jgi:hypothetical protein
VGGGRLVGVCGCGVCDGGVCRVSGWRDRGGVWGWGRVLGFFGILSQGS